MLLSWILDESSVSLHYTGAFTVQYLSTSQASSNSALLLIKQPSSNSEPLLIKPQTLSRTTVHFLERTANSADCKCILSEITTIWEVKDGHFWPNHMTLMNMTPLKNIYIFHYSRVEVCTGSKLQSEPGPYPRLSDPTRPDPSGTVKFRARTRPEIPPPPRPRPTANNQQKKRKKAAFHDCMQRNGLIKALPFHKHLPVMKVCEHQVQRSHTFCRVYEFCMDKKIILPPCKLWSFFVS